MNCVKTGCEVYLNEYNEWVRGDAFRFGDRFVFRISGRNLPRPGVVHYIVDRIEHWFDDRLTPEQMQHRPSTLIVRDLWIQDRGYDGADPDTLANIPVY